MRRLKYKLDQNGKTRSEYRSWLAMRERCYSKIHNRFHSHGARGIKVCDRWRYSFENFFEDMGPKPYPDWSIDRIDNNGDYSPENCRWASPKTQANNTRRNFLITFKGETNTLNYWSEKTGINRRTIAQRIRKGWSVEVALTKIP